MSQSRDTLSEPSWVVRSAQTLLHFVQIAACSLLVAWTGSSTACAQLYDALDAYPPRWKLDTSDCNARVIEHRHLQDGGVDGGACETITLAASHGSEALLAYRTEPLRPTDDLTATVAMMSIKPGCRIGFRVRYPYFRDAQSGRPTAVVIYGAPHERSGEFQTVGVGQIEREVRIKSISLRHEHGSAIDLRDPYVDAVIVNAYAGAGKMTIRLDELHVRGMISVGNDEALGSRSPTPSSPERSMQLRVGTDGENTRPQQENDHDPFGSRHEVGDAFPVGKVVRILQHNGEPFPWIRSLGFDAVLLTQGVNANLLRQAHQAQLTVYASPPTSPDPSIEPLLDTVAAWFVGAGIALDRSRIEQTGATVRRLRSLPARWQKPIIGAPSESWPHYATLLDAFVDDLPIRQRGLTAEEESREASSRDSRLGHRVQVAAGIATMPPIRSLHQSETIAAAIGAPPDGRYRWHSMWLQTIRSLERCPSAILFRSTRSLTDGTTMAMQRSAALSYTNRMIATIAPWIAGGRVLDPLTVTGAPYRCGRIGNHGMEFLLITSTAMRGTEVLAGDGQAIQITLPPDARAPSAWRLTHFSAERVQLTPGASGSTLEIVSPDAVEIVVISGDGTVGGKLAVSARRFQRRAATDRWTLTSDSMRQNEADWNQAISVGATSEMMPVDLITAASNTLKTAEPMYRAGDYEAALRMARRCDAWALRTRWRLSEALMPRWPAPTSSPPLECGMIPTQIAWAPLMREDGWGTDRLLTGGLDTPDLLQREVWKFGKRNVTRASSSAVWTQRGRFDGNGAVKLTSASLLDDSLPGGYEGTVAQLSSPPVLVPSGKAYRIDAMVRTIGFGNPHQGVLVYDSLGGQETGVLVRGGMGWTPVRLYRQATDETSVKVMIELLGSGEAVVDEITLRIWEPDDSEPLPLMPLNRESLRSSQRLPAVRGEGDGERDVIR